MTANPTKGLILGRFFNLIVYRYLKTFIIMAKIDLKFLCNSNDESYIKCEFSRESLPRPDEIYIVIVGSNGDPHEVYLDKSTAIRFAKTLRTEINKIQS